MRIQKDGSELEEKIFSALEQTHASIHRLAGVIGLSNTNESTYRSLFIEHICHNNPGVQCQTEWNRVDLLIRFKEQNVLIEFKYFLHRRHIELDGSQGNRKGGAGKQNKREFDFCVKQLHEDPSSPVHGKFLILVYEIVAPSLKTTSYSKFYDDIESCERIRKIERVSESQDDMLKSVLISIK